MVQSVSDLLSSLSLYFGAMASFNFLSLTVCIQVSLATYYSWDPYAIIENQVTRKIIETTNEKNVSMAQNALMSSLSKGLSPMDVLEKIPHGVYNLSNHTNA